MNVQIRAGPLRLYFYFPQDLLEQHQLLEVGGNTVRLVTLACAQPWLLHSVQLRDPEGLDRHQEDTQTSHAEGLTPESGTPSTKRPASPETDSFQDPPAKRPTLQDVRGALSEPETWAPSLPVAPEDIGVVGPPPVAEQDDQDDVGIPSSSNHELPGALGCQTKLLEGPEDPRGTELPTLCSPRGQRGFCVGGRF